MFASEKIVRAALVTTHQGLIFIRNHTLSEHVDAKCISSLADALHEVPSMVQQAQHFNGGEEQLLAVLRNHLACFQYNKWPGSPNLLAIFEQELGRA